MKRSLIFCAIALVAVAVNTASAAVDVQLNLRYDDPANEAAGGTWELLARSNGAGIAGISVLIDGLTGTAAAAGSANYNVFKTQTVTGTTEIVTGSDLATPSTDVGTGTGTTGNVAVDDLFASGSPWHNTALLSSGTFGAVRPSFVASAGTLNEGVNEFSGTDAIATTFNVQSVRGDGVGTDLLKSGDANRDGTVNGNDFSLLALNFNQAGGWDEGDFNSSGQIDGNDFSALALNFNMSSTAPAISSVPEPTALSLAALALLSLAAGRRRS